MSSESNRRELEGLKAVVTGSSSGIGRAIVLALAEGGADVVIHCRRSLPAAEEAARAASGHGVRASVLQADFENPTSYDPFVQAAWDAFGDVDVWVNNAGADLLTGPASHQSFERKLELLLRIDVTAAVHLGRAAGRRMKAAGKGLILNMGWDQAEQGMEGDSGELFGAAKGAIMAFSRSLALSLAPEVRVNCLAPGWVRTAWGEQASESWQRRVLEETPLRRWGTPEDVAAAARFLASPAARFITGQVLRINGGAVR
ncbi:MAG: SDR family oxidoreductase [Planctomycetes bacterium]|nr:SDR family oxidoreductase [Planctomycetota bacterium]